MFAIKACEREKSEAAMEWVPFGNRSAEAEHFFDEHNVESGHYGQSLIIFRLLLSGRAGSCE